MMYMAGGMGIMFIYKTYERDIDKFIKKASKKLDDWRLDDCEMYVTTEPCQMCAGAIVQARIPRVVIACMNAKAGCAGSVFNLLQVPKFNHQVDITRGVLETECSQMLSAFFKRLRVRKKQEKEAARAAAQEDMSLHSENTNLQTLAENAGSQLDEM